MGTRSAIGVMHGDKAKVVYCHWDGYLEHNGRILFDHYDSAKANHLVALGNISSLDKNIEIPEGVEHSFDKSAKGITVFYGRDRGEGPAEYIHENLGAVAGLGIGVGVYQWRKLAIKGFVAWVMHRGYHGLAMPMWERKLRVVGDWIGGFFLGRDIANDSALVEPRLQFETFASRPKA